MKTADARALNNLIGVRIGKFDVVAEIGTGGMATVYLARSVGGGGFQRLVAIKVMHRHLSSEDAFVEMFLDEARVAATIHHPNIVSILDVGLEDGLIFLVMDYVEGDSFSNVEKVAVTRRARIPLGIVLRVTLDSLAGLHAAHELRDVNGQHLKIIHRDVSPHNIVTGVDGISRIVDFGIAKAETRITTTKVGMIKGKLNFMAPEQIRNTPLDRRVDVFGMGVTLWEAITLRRLYAGENDFDTARKILAGEYPPLVQFDPALPPALDEICRRALHPDPDQRFRTAEEFAVAIERNLRDHIAPHREVGAFIASVASQKIDRERRALRESMANAAAVAPDLEIDETDDPEFMSSTMVDAELSDTAPALAPLSSPPMPVPLPSTAAPRNQASEYPQPQRSRFRASTMAMPVRGGPTKASVPPPPAGRDRRPSVQVPMPDAVMGPVAGQPDPHGAYEDDGVTSPFSMKNAAAVFSAVRGVPQPPENRRGDDDVEFGEARTVFKAPTNVPAAVEEALSRPSNVRTSEPPEGGDAAPKPGRTLAIDLVQLRSQPGETNKGPSGAPSAGPPSHPPSHATSQPGAGHGYISNPPPQPANTSGAYAQAGAPVEPTPAEEGGTMRAVLYVLLSFVLVGGAAGVLWYVLHQR